MTKFFKFVGPMFRYLAEAADENPKANTTLSSLVALGLGYVGLSPDNLAAIGDVLIKVGQMMGGTP